MHFELRSHEVHRDPQDLTRDPSFLDSPQFENDKLNAGCRVRVAPTLDIAARQP
jgi:hypothetical protein